MVEYRGELRTLESAEFEVSLFDGHSVRVRLGKALCGDLAWSSNIDDAKPNLCARLGFVEDFPEIFAADGFHV